MGGALPGEMMQYVLQTCTRLKHGLTVLSFQTESAARLQLKPYAEALLSAGISLQLVILAGEPIAGLAHYLRRHPEVAFLTCNEAGYLGRGILNGTQAQNALQVPVVLIASSSSALSTTQPAVTARSGQTA